MSDKQPLDRSDIDPGGKDERTSPAPLQLDMDRLAVATTLHHIQQVDASSGRIESYNAQLPPGSLADDPKELVDLPLYISTDTPSKFDEESTQHDSGIASTDSSIIPRADHTLDSLPTATTLTVTTIALEPTGKTSFSPLSEHDYLSRDSDHSLCTADFSSIGSFPGTFDSGVLMRDNSFASSVDRPKSDRTPTTSQPKSQSTRAESWHDDLTQHQNLRSFAHRMRFTDAEFDKSITELGPIGTDHDKLLSHLVKSRGSQPMPRPNPTAVVSKPKRQSSSRSSSQRAEGDSKGLRRIVIDGSNVAMEHGKHQIYSCRGIEIIVNYFQKRGHEFITVFVPAHRLRTEHLQTKDQHILNELSRKGVVVKTPSRKSSKGHIASYEDRFILKLASMDNAIVVSNDQFRDLKSESSAFRETIEKRILPFVFANDKFIPAEDPLGKRGPTLEQFLRVDPYNTGTGTCPYGRKCTYGTKCKYGHPEREESYDSAIGDVQSSTSTTGADNQLPSSGSSGSGYYGSVSRPADQQYQVDPYSVGQFVPGTANMPAGGGYYLLPTAASQHSAMNSVTPTRATLVHHSVDHPPTGFTMPPAIRAHVHPQSYRSMPPDDMQYYSRHPGQPSVTTSNDMLPSSQSTVSSLPSDRTSQHDMTSTSDSFTSDYASSGPLPLNEHLSTASTAHMSTQVAEGRPRMHTPKRLNPYDAEITPADSRYKLYFHLKNIFPEKTVRRVMNKQPTESDPNKITAAVLEMQKSKGSTVHDC